MNPGPAFAPLEGPLPSLDSVSRLCQRSVSATLVKEFHHTSFERILGTDDHEALTLNQFFKDVGAVSKLAG